MSMWWFFVVVWVVTTIGQQTLFGVVVVVDGFAVLGSSPNKVNTNDVLSRWLAIVNHLQNPDLYNAQAWADKAEIDGEHDDILVTSQDVTPGEILSLVPIDQLDIVKKEKNHHHQDTDTENNRLGLSYAFATNLTRPHEYHRAAGISQHMYVRIHTPPRSRQNAKGEVPPPGWRGHLATTSHESANCCVVPLVGAMPLCALVATKDMVAGTRLRTTSNQADDNDNASTAPEIVDHFALQVLKQYLAEITELRSFTAMAHPFPPYKPSHVDKLPQHQQFHVIDETYPGLRVLHKDPRVVSIDKFLSDSECQAIIDFARPRLMPCLIKNANTGNVEADRTRTSTNANIPQSVIPTVTAKVCRLLQAPTPNHLEIFQVLRYTEGQVFLPHTDGFEGPIDACGFDQSGRLVTLFVYLNTCSAGGETLFVHLNDLTLAPIQGQAVAHFPNTVTLQEDTRTEHESLPVRKGEKWLLVCWCWQHARSNPAYHEALI